ncbi:hypothetical protein R6Q59_034134 [Mikania micrantha]
MNMISESDSGCRTNGDDVSAGEIMLFGVRVKVDPMRKSVSMNDLSQYVAVTRDSSGNTNTNTNNLAAIAGDSGYASADDASRNPSNGGKERKRGVPWTEDEHKLFLLGLQKVGKGDWRGISRNFVKTRTPTQVASHAQKYFLRRSNLNRRRRRSSLFDITTASVAAIPMEEEQANEDNNSQIVSPISGFPMSGNGLAASPSLSPSPPLPPPQPMIKNQTETAAFDPMDQINTGPTLVSLFPTPNLSTLADYYPNQIIKKDSLSLSLSLSLSVSLPSLIEGFNNNGDGIISVV